jgi:hypothetical protein
VELVFDAREQPVSHKILVAVEDRDEAERRANSFAAAQRDCSWDAERACWQARDGSNRRVRYVTIATE